MIADFLEIVGQWITGMFGWITDGVGAVVELFYTSGENGGFTFIGMLALFALAVTLVYFIIGFVRSFIQK